MARPAIQLVTQLRPGRRIRPAQPSIASMLAAEKIRSKDIASAPYLYVVKITAI